jgi:cephalosporin hydroxylase
VTNPVIQRLVDEGSFVHRGQRYPIAHATPISVCQRYAELIAEHSLRRGLEVGTLFGLSTLFLAQALTEHGGHLDTIDIRHERRNWTDGQEIEDIHEVAEHLVAEAGLAEMVAFHHGHSNDILARMIQEQRRFDFALVDGSHVFAVALLDFLAVDRLLIDGGFLALDDVGANVSGKEGLGGGPNRLLESVFACGRYEITPWSRNVVVCKKLRSQS